MNIENDRYTLTKTELCAVVSRIFIRLNAPKQQTEVNDLVSKAIDDVRFEEHITEELVKKHALEDERFVLLDAVYQNASELNQRFLNGYPYK